MSKQVFVEAGKIETAEQELSAGQDDWLAVCEGLSLILHGVSLEPSVENFHLYD